jgi:serine O-acetyltransferase
MSDILKWFLTNDPKKSFELETQLMFYFHKKSRFLRKIFQRRIYYKYHCEISHLAIIDSSVQFIHPLGIVIGSQAIIEKNCHIYQQVTIGSNFNSNNAMPHIHEGCKIGAGAKLIGGITIGKNCIIGANSVITKSIPDDSIVVGANTILNTTPTKVSLL